MVCFSSHIISNFSVGFQTEINVDKYYVFNKRAVSDSQQNINILRGLAMQLQKIVSQENQKCWGKPLGSQSLWDGHLQTIQRIQEMASHVQISEVN